MGAIDGYLTAIKKLESTINLDKQIVLILILEGFSKRLSNTLNWFWFALSIGAASVFLMVLLPRIDEGELKNFLNNKKPREDDLKIFLGIFNPLGESKATAILLNINILVFVVLVLSGINPLSATPDELREIGALSKPEIENGEYWRIITSMFMHMGIAHLLANVFGLLLCGISLEQVIKPVRFAIVYLLSGVSGACASLYWYDNAVSVGASGPIFGLGGMMVVFLLFSIYSKGARTGHWIFIGLYFGISWLFGLMGGADNAAHTGGLVCGFLIGIVFVITFKDELKHNAKYVY